MTPLMISSSDWWVRQSSNSHISHITELSAHTAKRVSLSDTHTTLRHTNTPHTLVHWMLGKDICFHKSSCDFQNLPGNVIMLALAELFPPPVSLSSGHCTVLAGSEPKWGPFRGIFRYFHGRMERIFISSFSFSPTEQIQFWTTHRHTCTDTHKTHTSTSFADPNEQVKWVPAPSDFLDLLPTDRIPLQGPGSYLLQKQQ